MSTLSLKICDRTIRVACENSEAGDLLRQNYAGARAQFATADLNYTVGRQKDSGEFYIRRDGGEPLRTKVDGQFLYLFQKEITRQLQELRRDLYFVHSAALEYREMTFMLIGRSKSGKSTTTWALLQHGFRYLSDEIAPVDPQTLYVHPYPRALWLRRVSPAAQRAARKIETAWMVCIPTNEFPDGVVANPTPLRAIFFVCHNPDSARPSVWPVTKADSAAQILARTLNPGVHSENGLATAIELAMRTPCYQLFTGDLAETCAIVKDTLIDCFLSDDGPTLSNSMLG